MRRSRSWSSSALALLGVGMLSLGLGLGFLLSHYGCSRKAGRVEAPPPAPQRVPPPSPKAVKAPEAPSTRPGMPRQLQTGPRLAIVIDDLGYASPDLIRRLGALGVPLTAAALPFQEYTEASCEVARAFRMEILLHLPMEPIGYPGPHKDPGPGAVFVSMDEAQTRQTVRAALDAIPSCRGVNNHMGSRLTPDRRRMTWILEEVQKRGLFFVDSRTEKDSVAAEVAQHLRIPTVQRKVFLDDVRTPEGIRTQWDRALGLLAQGQEVLAIGHLHPVTVQALEELVPSQRTRVKFAHASNLARQVPTTNAAGMRGGPKGLSGQ